MQPNFTLQGTPPPARSEEEQKKGSMRQGLFLLLGSMLSMLLGVTPFVATVSAHARIPILQPPISEVVGYHATLTRGTITAIAATVTAPCFPPAQMQGGYATIGQGLSLGTGASNSAFLAVGFSYGGDTGYEHYQVRGYGQDNNGITLGYSSFEIQCQDVIQERIDYTDNTHFAVSAIDHTNGSSLTFSPQTIAGLSSAFLPARWTQANWSAGTTLTIGSATFPLASFSPLLFQHCEWTTLGQAHLLGTPNPTFTLSKTNVVNAQGSILAQTSDIDSAGAFHINWIAP